VADLPRGLDDDERLARLKRLVGRELTLKLIEVNPQRRRLVFSEREAQREAREQFKQQLLTDLAEGDVVRGKVSGMRDFGAFVDLGGADGLVHISELAWHRVKHPREVVQIGDEVEVYVLRLDSEGKRIGLSLKRLQPNPWTTAEENYYIGQLVEGTVSRVVSFGAFVELESGIEALLHVSQMSDPPPGDPTEVVHPGQHLVAQIIALEPQRQRMGLSLKALGEEERDSAFAEVAPIDAEEVGEDVIVDSGEALMETDIP
jgi:small subunit ribosomal protein S1